jgi:hypothetical protein
MPWIRALKDAEIEKYDAVCFGYYSDQRAKIYALSNPIARSYNANSFIDNFKLMVLSERMTG